MHQTMLQMCAAAIYAAHNTSQVQILASVPAHACVMHDSHASHNKSPAIIKHTQQGHRQILSANAAQCKAQVG